ncbi:hypothetical protein QP371_05455 [Gardnerella swidsinskii]|nr:hypothetical protein [Gardnerella swidsinskii]
MNTYRKLFAYIPQFKGLASEKTTLLLLINGSIPLFYQGNVKGNILN